MKKLAVLLMIIMSLNLFVGCSSDEEIILNYNVEQKIESLDPANATKEAEQVVIEAVFEGLCRLNQDGEAVPGVAERWEANADNTEFKFSLRKNATWSDKSPIKAEDFVFGLQRALMPQTGSNLLEDLFIIRNAVAVHNGQLSPEDLGVRAEDEHTVVIQLEKSYADFPKLTAGMRYMPCQKKFFESTQGRYGLDASNTLTNGPFTFSSIYAWESGEHVNLSKTKYYSGEHTAAATELVVTMNSEEVAKDPLAALSAGKIDVLSVSREEAQQLQQENIEIIEKQNDVFGLLFNTQATYLELKDFREMLFKSIERQDLLSRLRMNAEEAAGIVPKSVKWLNGESYQVANEALYTFYDENALSGLSSLLEREEWNEVPSIKILCQQDSYSAEAANGLIVSWNRQFLTSFNLEMVDSDTFTKRIANGQYEAALYTISSPDTTPNSFFRQFRSDDYITLMQNQSYDQQMNQLLFDKEAYRGLETMIRDEYVFYPICYANSYYAISPQTQNIIIREDGSIDFTKGTKKK